MFGRIRDMPFYNSIQFNLHQSIENDHKDDLAMIDLNTSQVSGY